MTDLDARLAELDLGVDGVDVVAPVLAAIAEPAPSGPARHGWVLRAAAATVVAAIAVVALAPGARRTVAEWFGLRHVEVQYAPAGPPATSPPATPPPATPAPAASTPAPGVSATVVVDGHTIVVSTIDGSLIGPIVKSVGPGTAVETVTVGGAPGLWISGEPHDLVYDSPSGRVVVEVAGNTLLWERGDLLYRLEGFDTLAGALAYATAHDVGAPAP